MDYADFRGDMSTYLDYLYDKRGIAGHYGHLESGGAAYTAQLLVPDCFLAKGLSITCSRIPGCTCTYYMRELVFLPAFAYLIDFVM